jgi:SAM-dependent methyltransferase
MTLDESLFDQVFTSEASHFVDDLGAEEPLAVQRWSADADEADETLFVDPCTGPTLDLGCGPGRLVQALLARGIDALGVDTSRSALGLARARGSVVIRRDLFDRLPGEGRWRHALLADGNIGIGGRPEELLERAARLVAPGGTVLVEVQESGGIVQETRRLRVDGALGAPFAWAVVGLDAVPRLADHARLVPTRTLHARGRWVAELTRPHPG